MNILKDKLNISVLLSVFVITVLYFCSVTPTFFQDADFGWHLMAGNLIREQNSVPDSDTWSYSAGQVKWINLSWAYDVILSFAYENFGFQGLVVLNLLLGALLITFISYLSLRVGAAWYTIIPCAVLCMIILVDGMAIRPHLFTFLFSALFYLIMITNRENQSNKSIWALPLLMVLWTNMHGGFVVGFSVIGAFWIENVQKKDFRNAKLIAIIGFLTALATLANPYFIEIFDEVKLQVFTSKAAKFITEWRPAKIGSDLQITLYFIAFLLCAKFQSTKIRLADKILAIFWFTAGLYSIRYSFVALVLATPFLARSMTETLDTYRPKDLNRDTIHILLTHKHSVRILAAVAASIVTLLAIPATLETIWQAKVEIPKEISVRNEINFIEKNYPNLKFMNDYDFGGYLILEGNGKFKVFVDGRSDTAYPLDFLDDYFEIFWAKATWKEMLNKYEVDGLLLSKRTPIAKHAELNPEWKKVYDTDIREIFVRKDKVK